MTWSTYNTLFRTEGLGRFCYSALSSRLLEVDEAHYAVLEGYGEGRAPSGAEEEEFLHLLRESQVLVDEGQEEGILLVHRYRREEACFGTSTLGLTICPTLRCNFRCPYCFEASQQDGGFMSAETQERLVEWVAADREARSLSVAWYGGEPLLAFDTMCALTERFLALDRAYEKAGLVTNGYLLDDDKIRRLNELRIESVQITLDGPRDVHDSRRVLAGGGPTFDRIVQNVEALVASDYAGACTIRVNLDRTNVDGFLRLRAELLERFKGTKLSVYPGHVDVMGGQAYDSGCCLATDEWAGFTLALARRHWVFPPGGFYPGASVRGTCVATRRQGHVVGPDGELYRCWDDVGRPSMVAGDIRAEGVITDPVLVARYVTGIDPYSDPECLACAVLPICGGGCAHRRLLVKYEGRNDIDYCSPYKTRLRESLEAYVFARRSRETCVALLRPGATAVERPAFRLFGAVQGDPVLAQEGTG